MICYLLESYCVILYNLQSRPFGRLFYLEGFFMSDNSQKEIDVLLAEKEVVVNGEKILIKPYSWAQSMKIVQPIGVLLEVVVSNVEKIDSALKNFSKSENKIGQIQTIIDLLDSVDVDKVTESMSYLIQLAIKKPKDYVDELMIDEIFDLGAAIYEVNKSFFKKRLAVMKLPSGK